jgi:hypothetical protein
MLGLAVSPALQLARRLCCARRQRHLRTFWHVLSPQASHRIRDIVRLQLQAMGELTTDKLLRVSCQLVANWYRESFAL